MLVTFFISELITGLYKLAKLSEEVAAKASELNDEFSNSKSTIEDYKKQIDSLHETIKDSSSSITEVTEARKSLLTIQDELIENFGSEKEVIDIVTDAINNQSTALDELTRKQWTQAKNEFIDAGFINSVGNALSGYDDNIDRMLKEYEKYSVKVDLSRIVSGIDTESYSDLKEQLIRDFGVTFSNFDSTWLFELSGDATEVYDKLLDIQVLLEDFNIRDGGSTYLADLANDAKDLSTEYKDFYNQYILYEKILTGGKYEESFKNINDAYEQYYQAKVSGNSEAVEAAKENFSNILAEATKDIPNVDSGVIDYFNNMYPVLYAEVKEWEFETKIIPTLDTSSIKGKSQNDILKIWQTDGIQDGEEEFKAILETASKYKIITGTNADKVKAMLDLLVEWGILQGDINEKTEEYKPPTFTESISAIENLHEGFEQLDTIYKDVKDKYKFDWANIVNNEDFTNIFGNMTNATDKYKKAYSDFIETISNNPDDLQACQDAFDDLATAYVINSGALDDLTKCNH